LKINPAHQSLILAGESPLLGQGSRLVAGGPAMPRVTLTTRAATSVVVQPEYFEPQRPARGLTQALLPSSAARRPLQLYASTQRGFEDPRVTALLDVFA
jgi:hypothetical protein